MDQLTHFKKVLDEVVITALGIKRQERELGYAVQTLDEDIQEVKSVNLVETQLITVTPGATG
jgi:hypothetical protein